MPVDKTAYSNILQELAPYQATLVAVSKTKPEADILALYQEGQRDFGENYVQELMFKQARLPMDIRWHFIGHLQSNKVKTIAPFVHLIHGVDSERLLQEIDKQAARQGRRIDVLLQVHIASEETKFGLEAAELNGILQQRERFTSVRIRGLMGMASLTNDQAQVKKEFHSLHELFLGHSSSFEEPVLSMGMSADYPFALQEGSNMIRIGSLLFGARRAP